MELQFNEVVEIKDHTNEIDNPLDWLTIECNEFDCQQLKEGKPIGFTYQDKQFLIMQING